MENNIAQTVGGLITSGNDAAIGAAELGDSVPLLQNPALKVRADYDAFVLAVDKVETMKAELAIRRAAVRQLARDGRGLLTLGRDVFKPVFGSEHNDAWTAVGLTDSLVIPRSPEEMQPVLRAFHSYLVANPNREVDPIDVTAGKYEEIYTGLITARAAIREEEVLFGEAMRERDEKGRILRRRLRDLIDELNMRLDPLDLRWKRFGFNMPGAEATPGVPDDVVVTLTGFNATAKWTATPRADYYHAWKKVVGVDEELVLVGSPADLNFTFEALPANATIELAVSAVNNGGESQPSEVVKIVTP